MAGKEDNYRIFVGGLSWETTDRQLEDAFSRYGKILEAQVYSSFLFNLEFADPIFFFRGVFP